MTLEAKRYQIRLLFRAAPRAQNKMMVLQPSLVGLAARDAKFQLHGCALKTPATPSWLIL
jgi:hypothetical protein